MEIHAPRTLYLALEAYRKKEGLKQYEVCARLKIGVTTYWRLKGGIGVKNIESYLRLTDKLRDYLPPPSASEAIPALMKEATNKAVETAVVSELTEPTQKKGKRANG